MPPCNRECRTTTPQLKIMAGTPPLKLLSADLLVGANRFGVPGCCVTLIHQLACLARSRMPSAMLCALTTHAVPPCSLLRRPIASARADSMLTVLACKKKTFSPSCPNTIKVKSNSFFYKHYVNVKHRSINISLRYASRS